MPHLIDKQMGKEAQILAQKRPPFGPGYDDETAARVSLLEIWGSSFEDSGGDFTVYKLYDKAGELFAQRRLGGY